MQDELDRHYPSLDVQIIGINLAGEEQHNEGMVRGHDLPWLQDVDSNNNGVSDLWYEAWQVVYRDVRIVDGDANESGVYNVTNHNLNIEAAYNELRTMIVDTAAEGSDPAFPYKHPVERLDVSNDGVITALDALFVVNKINETGVGDLPAVDGEPTAFYDAHVDNLLTAFDALDIINHLNKFATTTDGEPLPVGTNSAVSGSMIDAAEVAAAVSANGFNASDSLPEAEGESDPLAFELVLEQLADSDATVAYDTLSSKTTSVEIVTIDDDSADDVSTSGDSTSEVSTNDVDRLFESL